MNFSRYLYHKNRSDIFRDLSAVEFKQPTDYSMLPVQYGMNIEHPILNHILSRHPWHQLECDTISYLFKHLAAKKFYSAVDMDDEVQYTEAPTHFQYDAWANIKSHETITVPFVNHVNNHPRGCCLDHVSIYCEIPHRDQSVSPCPTNTPCYILGF